VDGSSIAEISRSASSALTVSFREHLQNLAAMFVHIFNS